LVEGSLKRLAFVLTNLGPLLGLGVEVIIALAKSANLAAAQA